MRDITYDQQTLNSSNPVARYAHRTRMRLALAFLADLCPNSGTVVEFGAGPGHFLHTLGETRSDITLIGYDPFMAPAYPEVRYAESLDTIETGSVDVLAGFEVCEHMYPDELESLLVDAARILKPGGTFIVSVPIMYGLSIIPKVLNWMMRGRTLKTGYTSAEVLKSIVGIRVPRADNLRIAHKGFDFRELREIIATRFPVDRAYHSPLSFLPWWMSSQYFMICDKTSPSKHA
jgi:SAM-dependent methyltransferase